MATNQLFRFLWLGSMMSVSALSQPVFALLSDNIAPSTSQNTITTQAVCDTPATWQDVESYDGTLGTSVGFVNSHQKPVGLVMWGATEMCTGTLLTGNHFLTAGKCFDEAISKDDVGSLSVIFGYQKDQNGNLKPGETFNVAAVAEHRVDDMDYTIATLAGNPNGQFSAAHLSTRIPDHGDRLTVIQHPRGQGIEHYLKLVDTGIFDGIVSTDTQSYMRVGNLSSGEKTSGAGVINNSGSVIGVHLSGNQESCKSDNEGVLNHEIDKVSTKMAQLADNDRDGLSNATERDIGTDIDLADSDSDGIDDKWERDNGLDPTDSSDALLDNDGDTYTNLDEYRAGTLPNDPESFIDITLVATLVPIIGLLLN